jgi:hypothetical protein
MGGGNNCQNGLDCNDDNMCEGEACGTVGLQCCEGVGMGGGNCVGVADCVEGTCELSTDGECGGFNDPCCEGGECNGALECNDGTCTFN